MPPNYQLFDKYINMFHPNSDPSPHSVFAIWQCLPVSPPDKSASFIFVLCRGSLKQHGEESKLYDAFCKLVFVTMETKLPVFSYLRIDTSSVTTGILAKQYHVL